MAHPTASFPTWLEYIKLETLRDCPSRHRGLPLTPILTHYAGLDAQKLCSRKTDLKQAFVFSRTFINDCTKLLRQMGNLSEPPVIQQCEGLFNEASVSEILFFNGISPVKSALDTVLSSIWENDVVLAEALYMVDVRTQHTTFDAYARIDHYYTFEPYSELEDDELSDRDVRWCSADEFQEAIELCREWHRNGKAGQRPRHP
ncbi:hypothetical protein PILCRDRAFT_90086 [Piloderma croceum F 1598]|uniref:Uncharacterized protein n=1 Tax=Piloderma croceum (strain F 1598) TaxID=765440 RepID=A0A0C3FJ16_PILCF|nr:hypothetical protein PILCRDRAFT_90086 [Piloderma croceum F 1598]